jgi:hypothetical protein
MSSTPAARRDKQHTETRRLYMTRQTAKRNIQASTANDRIFVQCKTFHILKKAKPLGRIDTYTRL